MLMPNIRPPKFLNHFNPLGRSFGSPFVRNVCISNAVSNVMRVKGVILTCLMCGKRSLILIVTLVLDVGRDMNHKLSSRFESVDFEGAAKLADS
jgi:hypothetical protein